MNKSFLACVAEDVIRKHGTDLSRVAVIFPNKRASLFMNEHLAHVAARPIWSPSYITISDLFRAHSRLTVADPIRLICNLHKVFTRVTGINETLDHFYSWGQLILADFDDIDKNMADARKVYLNLRDLHELDDLTYLSESQRTILTKFFSNFSPDQHSILKERFLKLWSHFHDLYAAFNEQLKAQGLAYEGALYRDVAEHLEDSGSDFFEHYDTYIFVGFNMLQHVEQRLFTHLKHAGHAHFYWDFDRYYMGSEAGHYISQYLADFPNELDNADETIYNCFSTPKDVAYVSAPTENAQARYISQWLREGSRIADGRRTAIVLCDENLLQSAVHCLPPEVQKVNITTGYPLSQSPFVSLVNLLIDLYADCRPRQQFRLLQQLRRHPYMRFIADESLIAVHPEEPRAEEQAAPTLFDTQNQALTEWLIKILKHVAANSRATTDDPFFQESLFQLYTIVNRLHELILSGDLQTDIQTLQRLLLQVVSTTSIPFHGEPAEGIQVMGVLETRNLDFDHVLLLSCNEGNMPRGVNDSSFIPYSIRKAYDLTTIDNKVAIYAYYFHRLLQRAADVTILYNNSTEDGRAHEMSRFMLQMLVESPHQIARKALQAGKTVERNQPKAVDKSESVARRLQEITALSPTAINRYLRCQLQFYFHTIAHIKEPIAPPEDASDHRAFGNIFHHAAQLVYQQLKDRSQLVRAADIDDVLQHPEVVGRAVDQAFREEFSKTVSPRALKATLSSGLHLINRRVIIGYIEQLLRIDRDYAPFSIIGLEKPVSQTIGLSASTGSTLEIGGIIDRIDSKDGRVRIVDYKTGNHVADALPSIESIFTGDEILKKHSDYFLQTLLYAVIIKNDEDLKSSHTSVAPALLYIQHARGKDYDPVLKIGRQRIDDISVYESEFMQRLHALLEEIFDVKQPFTPTDDRRRCATCPYKELCF
ncbi:MAG: PD-(D/E)XK nuclease family protein [Prevotella sp.]|nr:PD-(D/E)XK nuclease family protein [Prevotella sp.]